MELRKCITRQNYKDILLQIVKLAIGTRKIIYAITSVDAIARSC